jgi:hypothetical protein
MSSIDPSIPNPALTPEDVLRQLRLLREQIVLPVSTPAPAALRRRLSHVHPAFIEAAVNAVGASEFAQQGLGRTDADLRAEIDLSARWTTVTDEMRSFLHTLEAANTVRRQSIGLAALQTYQICRQLARDERHAARLRTHIAEMKRLNTFGRRRRKTPSDGEALAKTPPAQPQTS